MLSSHFCTRLGPAGAGGAPELQHRLPLSSAPGDACFVRSGPARPPRTRAGARGGASLPALTPAARPAKGEYRPAWLSMPAGGLSENQRNSALPHYSLDRFWGK